MNITKGKVQKPKKVVIYGTEGIGKSTFAAQFPNPLFIDTEGSTNELDVSRFDKPTSWQMLKSQIDYVIQNKPCTTLVIDTIDWAEKLCITSLCAQHGKDGIEAFGYGNGWTYEGEEFGKFLNRLDDVIAVGINVVLTAHAIIRKFEQPDEMGAYDRYELKLGKKTTNLISPMIREWADMVLFANYKTYAVQTDKDGKKHKAQGGQRVMYTTHHPCWDAKNRYGLAEELPFDYSQIAHIIPGSGVPTTYAAPAAQTAPPTTPAPSVPVPPPTEKPVPAYTQPLDVDNDYEEINTASAPVTDDIYEGLPKALVDLMKPNNVTPAELQTVVAQRGYYPLDTPITAYEPAFVEGCIIGAWSAVLDMIQEIKAVPFD